SADGRFDVTADGLISLQQQGVPAVVMDAMLRSQTPPKREDNRASSVGSQVNSQGFVPGNAENADLVRTFAVHGNHKAGRMWEGILTLRPGRIAWKAEG